MHKPLTGFFFLLLPAALLAQTPRQVRVSLDEARIFLNGAEMTSTSKISLPAGETDILFTNIAGSVNQQSLTIGADNNVVVQSATFQNNYLSAADSLLTPRGKAITDSIGNMAVRRELLNEKRRVVEEQITIFNQNKTVAGANTGLNVAELQKLLDLTATRMAALLAEQRELMAQIKKLDDQSALLTRQLDEERRKDYQPGGQLLVKLYTPRATTTAIAMTYVVPNAGWTPSYDLRVDKINDPVKLFYKATVYQNSGVKWDNVKLSLSTGNPNESAEAPVLNPWQLAFAQPGQYGYGKDRSNYIQLNRGQTRTLNAGELERLPSLSPTNAASLGTGVYQQGNGAGLSIAGGRYSGTKYIVDGVQMNPGSAAFTTMDQYTAVDNAGIATTFDIDLPYTIPSDGQPHTVAVKDYQLPATYRHIAVPKLDRDAFLQAQITDWEDLNLLPAQTNVFFEGSYVGQGYIDMRNVRDTMSLSLGRDKKIIIRRERDKTFSSDKTIGSNVREQFAYTISVRNTRKEAVRLVLLEQFPLSTDDDIRIEEKDTDPDAVVDDATGAARWTIVAKPGELQKYRLSWTVKYPRSKTIGNLR